VRNIIAIFLLSALAFAPAQAGDTPDFSHYPQSEPFLSALRYQTNGAAQMGQTNLLAIQSFFSTNTLSTSFYVKQYGFEENARYLPYAIQAYHARQLSADSLKDLRSVILELPSHNESPSLDQLVLVSFRDGTNWVTRSYDNQALPTPMLKIYDIISKAQKVGL
jgi:hypothetical protein